MSFFDLLDPSKDAAAFKSVIENAIKNLTISLVEQIIPKVKDAGGQLTVDAITGSPVATAYRSSNVGTGTTVGKQVVGAGATMELDLASKGLLAGQNLTLRTDSITATVIINVQWQELNPCGRFLS